MIFGYARVSTIDQHLESQIEQLNKYGVDKIYKEKKSGANTNRPELQKLLDVIRHGDKIVITKMDRLARSTHDMLDIINDFEKKGVGVVILNMGGDTLDTTSPIGKLMVTVMSGIAEFELGMIKERQREGIAQAKRRGAYKGKPRKYTEKSPKVKHAMALLADRDNNNMTVNEISDITGISRASIYRIKRKYFDIVKKETI